MGYLFAVLAYVLWGLLPLYWKWVDWMPLDLAIAYRVVFACASLLLVLAFKQEVRSVLRILAQPKLALPLLASSTLIISNWMIFVWAVYNNEVLQASLGYFVSPLLSVFLGVLFFREQLEKTQWVAVAIATLGISWMMLSTGQIPWVAIGLAGTFGFYGVIRRQVPVASTAGLAFETLIAAPFAMVFILGRELIAQADFHLFERAPLDIAAITASGLITTLPLIFFAKAARLIPFSNLGFFQYIAPIIQLLIAVFLLGSQFDRPQLMAFLATWVALLLYSTGIFLGLRRRAVAH